MGWITDEVLFYGGIILIIFSVCFGALMFALLKFRKHRLALQLDKEYGRIDKKSAIRKGEGSNG